MTIKIVTIGVYGFDEVQFFQALQQAKVDTFCDIRQRRGLRGTAYAFANSKRLQAKLAEMGIRYFHQKALAPTREIRQQQKDADKRSKTAKRERSDLGAEFIGAYREKILAGFDSVVWHNGLPPDANVVALFCVEREPQACHRSLLAEKIRDDLAVSVEHILP